LQRLKAAYLDGRRGDDLDRARTQWAEALRKNPFNPNWAGFAGALQALADRLRQSGDTHPLPQPRIFASEAAHYPHLTDANVLGYGEETVKLIPSDRQFRLDVEQLRRQLADLQPGEYVAAVVGILGTTEEGAVDPVHQVLNLREELWRAQGLSF